jgi:Iap family predicted aminopeptidase
MNHSFHDEVAGASASASTIAGGDGEVDASSWVRQVLAARFMVSSLSSKRADGWMDGEESLV